MEETQTQEVAQEQPAEQAVEAQAEAVAAPVEKLYQLAIRKEGAERFLTVIADDVRAAIAKVADKIAAEEHIFEAKYINEVHVK